MSFLATKYVLPHSIRKLQQNGYVSQDMYKKDKPEIATNVGMILVFTSFISVSLVPLFVRILSLLHPFDFETSDLSETHLAFLLVVSIYALYGLVDDLVDIGRILKLILPITFSYPLISVVIPQMIWVPLFGEQNLDSFIFSDITKADIFRIIIIPVYVMVVANLVNMHSGYNGLQSGLSIILMVTLCIKSYLDGILVNIIPLASIMGAIMAFYAFNKYPAKALEGNIGSLFFGSAIGAAIVVQNYWWFGFYILIPHTINFFLWISWLFLMKKYPDDYLLDGNNHQKFGQIREDQTIEVPNPLTMKWLPNYYYKLTESQSTYIMYIVTFFFCLSAILYNLQ